jgi:hypothetical protein
MIPYSAVCFTVDCYRYHREGAESWTRRAHTYNMTCAFGALKAATSTSLSSLSSFTPSSLSTSMSSSSSSLSSASFHSLSSSSSSSSISSPSLLTSSPTSISSSSWTVSSYYDPKETSSYYPKEPLPFKEHSSAAASSPSDSVLSPLFNDSTTMSPPRSVSHINSNKIILKKQLCEFHYKTSTSHHSSLNGVKRLKCGTPYCVPHNAQHATQHSTQHSTQHNKQHRAHNFDKRQKTDRHQNSNANLNSNEFATAADRDTVLQENSYVTRAAVVDYCK